MISCLIIRGNNIKKLTRKQTLLSLLKHKDYEIEEHIDEQTVIFVWNERREVIWQYVFHLEFSGFEVGYGFGRNKSEAMEDAREIFKKRDQLMR